MKIGDWISFFLKSNGRDLASPDGRPLFAYQMSIHEFEDLQRCLKTCFVMWDCGSDFNLDIEKLFVIYGAEWWRRNYEGGSWKWQLITDSLGLGELPREEITTWVKGGLKYWKRDLHRYSAGNAYLTTIVLEGGIPLSLLNQQGANFTRYLKAIMGEHAKWSSAGMSAASHAATCQRLLPKSLRREQIFQLAAEIVDALYMLSDGLESKSDPYTELNEKQPDWFKRLPMALESEGARSLVDALLKEAQKKRKTKYERFQIIRYLYEVDGQWKQKAKLEIPDNIPTAVLAEQLQIPTKNLSSRMELVARTNGLTLKVASLMRVNRENDEFVVSFYRRDKLSFDLPFFESISCTLQSAGESIGDYIVEGSEAVDLDLPMLFVSDDSLGYRLLGAGSITSRVEQGILVLPSGAIIQEGAAEKLDNMLSGMSVFEFRDIYSISGEVLIKLEDGFQSRIRLGANSDTSTHYSLSGNRIYAVEQKGIPAYSGMPNLISPKGGVKPNKIIWRSEYSGAEWFDASVAKPLGCIRLRALCDNQCLFATKIIILPSNFSYAIHRSDDINEGALILEGMDGAEINYNANNQLVIDVERKSDLARITCKSNGAGGGRFPLNLGWSAGRYCVVSLPFPGKGARFTNVEKGTSCGRRISIVDLLMVSAQAVSPQEGARYTLVAELRADDVEKSISRSSMYFSRDIPSVSNGFYELPLFGLYTQIKELFSYSADLDAVVRFEILSGGHQEVFVDVVQFKRELHFDASTGLVCHQSVSSDVTDVLKLLPFDHDEEIQELSSSLNCPEDESGGCWELNDRKLNGSGLVIVDGQLGRLVRPCVMYSRDTNTVKEAETIDSNEYSDNKVVTHDEEVSQLNAVWSMASFKSRKYQFAQIFKTLPESPGSEDWVTLVNYVDRFKETHPDCLDAHKVLIDSPGAILGTIFRSQPEVIDVIMEWEEYLPFRLWMIPIKFWRQAMESYLSYLKPFGDLVTGAERAKIINILKQIKQREPNTLLIVNQLLAELGEVQEETDYDIDYAGSGSFKEYTSQIQKDIASTLFNRPDDERWPGGIDREIWNTLVKNPLWLDPGIGYRRAFLDAPICMAFCIANGYYLERKHRAFVAATRNFDSRSFDILFLKYLVMFLKLIR